MSREYRLLKQLMLSSIALLGLGAVQSTSAVTLVPVYQHVFEDAVTGDNQFIGTDNKHYWFVNTGADNYANDYYERPTVQTYRNATVKTAVGSDSQLVVGETYYAAGGSSPSYFQYLDIVQGHYGTVGDYLFFGIELYGKGQVGDNGVVTTDKFGESTYYRIQLGNDPNGAGGLLLSAENPKDLTADWKLKESMAYLDLNRDVGGPNGITAVNENPGSLNGYEVKIISDGQAQIGAKPDLLQTRLVTTEEGRPMVEFAFNFALFNQLYPGYALTIDPLDPLYVVFEATRGQKGNANYLWNDKYSLNQAGTPYADGAGQPQNLYELDTLRAVAITTVPDVPVVPTPTAALAGLASLGLMLLRRRRGLPQLN